MKFIYIDESGNTGKHLDLQQPYHLVCGLIVDVTQINLIEKNIRSLGIKYFGSTANTFDFEFHAYDLHQGKNIFEVLELNQRRELLHELLNIIISYDLKIIYTVIDKTESFFLANSHPHHTAFMSLIEEIEDYLININSLGLLIADEFSELEKNLCTEFESLKSKEIATDSILKYKKINYLVDSIHFVKSHTNHLIQLTDLACYILMRGHRARKELMKHYVGSNDFKKPFEEFIFNFATVQQKMDLNNVSFLNQKMQKIMYIMNEKPIKSTNQGLATEAR